MLRVHESPFKIHLLFLLLLSSVTGFSQTDIPAGIVSGTWTKALSPYIVNGNIVVEANQKLVIEAGVEVRFSGSYSLSIEGCLQATGTETDSIRFTVTDKSGFSNNTHVGWRGLRFQNVQHPDSSAIEYCVLEYGKTGADSEQNGGAIFTSGFGRLRLRHTTLRDNISVYGGAITAVEVADLRLKEIVFEGNYASEQGGALAAFTSGLTLTNCKLIRNSAKYGGGGLFASHAATVNLDNCLVLGNKGGAMEIFWECKVNIDRSTIAGNTGSPDGFDLYNSDLTCKNSILWNKTDNNTYSEIATNGGYANVTLNYCLVKGIASSEWNLNHTSGQDPLFLDLPGFNVDLSWTGFPNKDATRSPAIDAGDPTSPHDPDGTIADIGALPYAQTSDAFPTVSFASDITQNLIPLTVNFKNYTTQALGDITSWNWYFGDNTTSTDKNPTHVYTEPGIYDVKLVAVNQNGKKDSLTLERYIKALGGTLVNSATVEGQWSKQNSPYNIYNDITVPEGKTLTIEPGVDVVFFGHYTLNVNGNLLARGTATDSITFDRFDSQSSWHSIRIENVGEGSDSTIFEYCRIAHATYLGGNVLTNGGNGILVKNFNKVRISHCLIRDNHGGRGAGVYAEKANIRINNNVIRKNSAAQYGTGIYVDSGSPVITGNTIVQNYASDGAAGLWLSASASKVEDNIISYNSSYWGGTGTVISNGSTSTLLRNIISYNESGHDDGGGLLISESSPKIINNTIVFNKAEEGEGVLIRGNSAPQFINTIVYYNRDRYQDANTVDEIYIETPVARPDFYNCNLQGGVSGIRMYTGAFMGSASDVIDAFPLFKNSTANDFSLLWHNYPVVDQSKSPCIDAGVIDSPHDPDGSVADLGAKYFHQTQGIFPPRADFVADTLLGYNKLSVAFTDLSDKGNSELSEWHWDFGDGGTSVEQNPVHEYKSEGTFSVTLTIKDGNGIEQTLERTDYIRIIKGLYIKGNIEGILDEPRYLVGGDLIIEDGKSLQVKPGVEFMFLGPYQLDVRGALKAMGTSAKPIVFTSYDTTGLDLQHAVTGYTQNRGGWGGIYVYASGAQDSTVIDHCKIHFVENNGQGAIYAFSNNGAAGMRISNCEISYNSTQGISVFSTKLIIRNNYIHHNYCRAYQKGAGIYFYAGSPQIINNIISNNQTADDGGGMCIDWDSRPTVIGNVITHNKAGRAGGICDYAGYLELINNTIAYNTSTNSTGGGYYILYAGDVKFTNNIITNNSPAQVEVADWYTRVGFQNCILEGGKEGIIGYETSVFLYENVLTTNPKLVTGTNAHGRLLPDSPAVDAGITETVSAFLPARDVVGNVRIKDNQVDIGAYEYVPDPPMFVEKQLADVNKMEDFEPFIVSIDSVFSFKYGQEFLSFRVDITNPEMLLEAEVRGRALYINSSPDRFGDQVVRVIGSNGTTELETSFTVHIAPVDDPPHFDLPGDLYLLEDFTGPVFYQINYGIPFGEENQSRSFELEPTSVEFAGIQLDQNGLLSISPKANIFGAQSLTITLTEGEQSYSKSFVLSVQSVNDPPVINVNTTPVKIEQGQEETIPVSVSDVDNEFVTLSTQAAGFLSVETMITGTNTYDINITGQYPGPGQIILSANDGELTTSVTIPITTIVVVGIEDEPVTFEAYPNPTTDLIRLKAKINSSIALYDLKGVVVITDKINREDFTLSLAHLRSGLYVLSITDGINTRTLKIRKE